MAKKRTRAQKIKAQRTFQPQLKLPNSHKFDPPASNVKGQFEKNPTSVISEEGGSHSPIKTEDYGNLKLIKKDLLKSLFFASFILCLEIVLYLLWYK
jgi:hypothetical protein